MPIEKVNSLEYYLIAYDAKGKEREEREGDPNSLMSTVVLKELADNPITDVFLMSHGWMGDVPAAKRQYNKWIGAMAANQADIDKIKQVRPGFRPLLIGLHWPSLPYGDENLGDGSVSFDTSADSPVEQLIDQYAERIADTEVTREALRTIFVEAMDNMAPDELPSEVREAYEVLNQEAALGYDGVGGAPEADCEAFDPDSIFQAAAENAEPVSFGWLGDFLKSIILAPLRNLSFWKMKERARKIGESAGFNLLEKLQQTSTDSVQFHLMGHSLGCIVVSATLTGLNGRGTLVRPVNSVVLVQGALSLWSYCSNIPKAPGQSGYFHSIIAEHKVAGPIITTQSEHDTAVGTMYPPAAGVAGQVHFAPGELPKYGALGSYGAQRLDIEEQIDMDMLPSDGVYSFEAGKIYNLESSNFIRKTDKDSLGSGAHNNIYNPEVAHAVWSAALGVSKK